MSLEEAAEYALFKDESDAFTSPLLEEPLTGAPTGKLTSREREVAVLVARGLTNRQISTELSISERTAGNHVGRILSKLGLRSRAQLANWAAEHRLSAPGPD